ncbi:MAG: integrase family protein [Pseudoxanthomonas sp.]
MTQGLLKEQPNRMEIVVRSEILTARAVAALKPGEWAADPAARGAGRLQVRKLASGEMVWYYRYAGPDGVRVRLPLGSGLTLAGARKLAADLSRRYQAGERDLRGVLEAEQRAAERSRREAEASAAAAQAAADSRTGTTLKKLMAAYIAQLKAAGKPSWREVEAAIERNLNKRFPDIADLQADVVTVDDVMPVFHRLAKGGKLREAEKLRSYLRAAYTAARRARHDASMHAFTGFRIASNPLADLEVTRPREAVEKAAKVAKARKWALSEEQLRHYWRRINALENPDKALLVFHLLTGGQRVVQLARLTKSDHDVDRKTVTLRDTKGRRKVAHDHVVPLIPDAETALEAMRGDNGDFLFTVTGGFEAAAYHSLRPRLRPVVEAMVKAKEVERAFSPGILRKTVESRLQAAGVSREVRGYLLSHGLGGVQARHYEAHEFDAEKRAALEKLRALLI